MHESVLNGAALIKNKQTKLDCNKQSLFKTIILFLDTLDRYCIYMCSTSNVALMQLDTKSAISSGWASTLMMLLTREAACACFPFITAPDSLPPLLSNAQPWL